MNSCAVWFVWTRNRRWNQIVPDHLESIRSPVVCTTAYFHPNEVMGVVCKGLCQVARVVG
jgi:hypothetical protein